MLHFPWTAGIHLNLLLLIILINQRRKNKNLMPFFIIHHENCVEWIGFLKGYISNYSTHINDCGSVMGSSEWRQKLFLARTACFFQYAS